MLNEENFDTLSTQIRKISHLLAIITTEGKMQSERVAILLQSGFSIQEVSELLGVTANAVRLVKHKSKKKKEAIKKQEDSV